LVTNELANLGLHTSAGLGPLCVHHFQEIMGNSTSHPHGPNGPVSQHMQGPGPPSSSHRHTHSQSQRRPSPQTRMSSDGQRNSSVNVNANVNVNGPPASATGRPLKSKKKSLELPDLNLNSLSTITPVPQRVPSTLPSAPIPIPANANANANANPNAKDADAGPAAARNQRTISEDALAAGPSSLVVAPPPPLAPTKISSNASFGRKEKKVPKRQKAPYSERVVRSMLYSGVPTNHDGIVNVLAPTTAPKVQVQLLYPGQADSVSVSGTYEASWDIRTDLQYE
jgi:hypothetical protein